MKFASRLGVILFAVSMLASPATASDVKLARYKGGFFNIQIPQGWDVHTAGQCGNLALVIRDKKNPLNQIFSFGDVGPVYMSDRQKQIDANYMNMGGCPVAWIEMPVVDPLTPANFMRHFTDIASTPSARRFMPQAPRLENFTVISVEERPCMIPGGKTAMVRAVFTKNGKAGEGMFLCTVAPGVPFTGGPGGGIAHGSLINGVTATKGRFAELLPVLRRCLESYQIDPTYVKRCVQASGAAFQQVQSAGQTLSETSDMIMEGWQERNKRYDTMAEKRSDAMLGFERVYDPDTQETYQVDPQFWEDYQVNSEHFEMNDLEKVPENDHELWDKAPQPQREIR